MIKRILPILFILILLLGQAVTVLATEDLSDPPSTAPSESIPPIEPEPNGDIEDNVEDNTETNEEDNTEDSTHSVPETPQELLEITQIFNVGLLTKNIAINYGDTAELEDLKDLLTSQFRFLAGLTDDDEEALLVLEQMELGNIDVFKPGTYPVTVILKLHENYANEFTISDEMRTLRFNIYVAEKEGIWLLFISAVTNRIQYNIANPQEGLSLWYAVTEHGAEPDKEAWQLSPTDGLSIVNWDSLYIYRDKLTTEQDYLFQLRGTDVTSNIIRINLAELPDGSDGNYMGGDKDGNDNDDNTLVPPLTQIPPLPPVSGGNSSENDDIITPSESVTSTITIPSESSKENSNSLDSVIVIKPVPEEDLRSYERVDGDTMTISGARLEWLMQRNTAYIPFGWNQVSLEIPTEVLSALSLSSNEILSLTLTKDSHLSFTVDLVANGMNIQNLGQTIVRLPAPEPQGRYTLSLAGAPVANSVSFENGYAVFIIEQIGYYQLAEEEATEISQTQSHSSADVVDTLPLPEKRDFIPLALVGIILLAGGAFLLWRKTHDLDR